jgi:hypothetical protein
MAMLATPNAITPLSRMVEIDLILFSSLDRPVEGAVKPLLALLCCLVSAPQRLGMIIHVSDMSSF